jgi:hypothetical protein
MKKIASAIIVALLFPFFAGIAVELAKPQLEHAPLVIRWIAMLVDWSGFPWVAAGSLGFLAGIWLDGILSRLDGRHPMTWAGKAKLLADRVSFVALRCENAQDHGYFEQEDRNGLMSEIVVLGAKLRDIGIEGPHILQTDEVKEVFGKVAAHFRAITPALREGDKNIARQIDARIREMQTRPKGLVKRPE